MNRILIEISRSLDSTTVKAILVRFQMEMRNMLLDNGKKLIVVM